MTDLENFKPPYFYKTHDQLESIITTLKKSFLTKNLTYLEVKSLAEAMVSKKYQKDEIIVKYGDFGQEYFILEKGNVEVIVYKEGTNPNDQNNPANISFAKYLGAGVGFGEIALIYNERRTATIKTVDPCELWVLDGKIFKKIVIKSVR